MVAAGHLNEHMGQGKAQSVEGQQQENGVPPGSPQPQKSGQGQKDHHIVKAVAYHHAYLHEALRPGEAVGVASQLVISQESEELGL